MLSIHRIRSNIEPDKHRSAVAFPDFIQLKMNWKYFSVQPVCALQFPGIAAVSRRSKKSNFFGAKKFEVTKQFSLKKLNLTRVTKYKFSFFHSLTYFIGATG